MGLLDEGYTGSDASLDDVVGALTRVRALGALPSPASTRKLGPRSKLKSLKDLDLDKDPSDFETISIDLPHWLLAEILEVARGRDLEPDEVMLEVLMAALQGAEWAPIWLKRLVYQGGYSQNC